MSKRDALAAVPHADSPQLCLTGAGEVDRPGEEVPRLDGGEEPFEEQRRCGGGEWRRGELVAPDQSDPL